MHPGKTDSALPVVLLCLAAGYVDATGYLHQQVFAANMTGNTVLAGISLAQREWVTALERASTLLAFFGGATLSGMLMTFKGVASRLSLPAEAALLAVACALDPNQPAWLWLTATAMGIQATVMVSYRRTAVSTVVLTGTMARLAQALVSRLLGSTQPERSSAEPAAGPLALTWILYFVGAAIGALAGPVVAPSLLPGVALVLIAAGVQWLRGSRSSA